MGSFAGSDPKTKADPATGNDSELMLPFVGLPLFGEIWNKKFSKEVWKGNERYIMVYIYIQLYTYTCLLMFTLQIGWSNGSPTHWTNDEVARGQPGDSKRNPRVLVLEASGDLYPMTR